jgi:SAM-dependent methyltransferase
VRVAEYKRLLTQACDLDKPVAPPDMLERWSRHAHAADGPVLEVMCGSGRLLVPLAEVGIDIDGIDASEAMLDACREKCAARGLQPELRAQFVHELAMTRRYALVFIAAGSFGLLVEEHDYRTSLRKLFEHVAAGGRLILDVETPAAAPRGSGLWRGRWWTRDDGAKIVERALNRYDRATQIDEGLNIYELFVDGQLVETELNDWVRRFWEPDALEAELTRAGFVDIEVRGVVPNPDGEPTGLVATACRR